MKKFHFLLLIILFMSKFSFGQEVPKSNPKYTVEYYNKKASSQRTAGCLLFTTAIISFAVVFPQTQTLDGAVTAIGVGGYSLIGGTILYLASVRNKKKVRKLSAVPGVQKIENTFTSEKYKKIIPVVTFKVRL